MEISCNLIENTLERDIRAFTIPLYIKEGKVPEVVERGGLENRPYYYN
jgi:hypothetical protein